jgi:glutathione S-transferase
MNMKIFGKASSINVRKVLWTCAELGQIYDLTEYGSGTSNDVNSAEFLALNPNGMVPVVQDDGVTLWESNSICRYLASKHARVDLLPAQAMPRAQVEKWMDWQATELNNSWRYAFMSTVRQSPAHQDRDMLAASVKSWNHHMAILARQLDHTGAYVDGAVFTLADIVIGLSVNRWRAAPIAHASLPAIDAYFDLLRQRPGFLQFGCNGIP